MKSYEHTQITNFAFPDYCHNDGERNLVIFQRLPNMDDFCNGHLNVDIKIHTDFWYLYKLTSSQGHILN